MVIFSTRKIENAVIHKAITPKQFAVYSFCVLGPFFSLIKISRYPVYIEVYDFAFVLSFVPSLINILKYFYCYRLMKDSNILLYLYAILPITFILSVRYTLLVMLPLVVANVTLIKYFGLDFAYWNVVNSQLISIAAELCIAVNLVRVMKRVYGKGASIGNLLYQGIFNLGCVTRFRKSEF
jgi:hypothetical protein